MFSGGGWLSSKLLGPGVSAYQVEMGGEILKNLQSRTPTIQCQRVV